MYKGIPNGPNTYCCDPKCGKGHPKGKGCGGAGCSKNGDECCSGDFVNQACKNKKRAPCRNPWQIKKSSQEGDPTKLQKFIISDV